MAKSAAKLKAKKKCCVSKPRCKRCPVRLKAKAAKRAKKQAKRRK
jgi:hypothetical protein